MNIDKIIWSIKFGELYCMECLVLYTVGCLFRAVNLADFMILKYHKNYFRGNQNNTVQDGRRHKFVKIKSAK